MQTNEVYTARVRRRRRQARARRGEELQPPQQDLADETHIGNGVPAPGNIAFTYGGLFGVIFIYLSSNGAFNGGAPVHLCSCNDGRSNGSRVFTPSR
ncbi:hypothetical protein EVAR_50019_1 [Eumeta japonica]|uniref:Uncharacterized protein n=1 Tax=Eumeta variegata TaxID=151549 RepID=A0A4C1YRJ1_EUMVA|nr:hypothetical protein EVAR_50019_1 [Eumeta japonica]